MLDDQEILNLELSCGKWDVKKQKEVMALIKTLVREYNDIDLFGDEDPE